MNAVDSLYINRLRGASILRVVLGHLGLGWVLLPYSSYIGIFLSVLFFCSGYIFIYLFYKSSSVKDYLIDRALGILTPFYIIYIFAILVYLLLGNPIHNFGLKYLFQILIVAPEIRDMPYPLGQIWYLRVLIFCALISPLFFVLAKKNKYVLLFPVVIATAFAAIQTGYKFHKNFFYFGHNLLQEILYGAYFFIGSFLYLTDWRNKKGTITFFLILCVLVSFVTVSFLDLNLNLGYHSYAPNLYYFPLGVAGILLVLLFSTQLEWCFANFKYLAKLLDFCSKHSYGIYLNHSFFIVFYEYAFGLKGVFSSPLLAITKVILVVASSLIFAVPITFISRKIVTFLKGLRGNKK